MIPFSRGKFVGPVPCKVTAVSVIAGPDPADPDFPPRTTIWRYTVQPIVWKTTDYVGSTDTYTEQEFYAINLDELGNTETEAMGVIIADLPGDFELKPVPTGRVVLVWMSPGGGVDTNEIETLAVFQWPNQFDGTC